MHSVLYVAAHGNREEVEQKSVLGAGESQIAIGGMLLREFSSFDHGLTTPSFNTPWNALSPYKICCVSDIWWYSWAGETKISVAGAGIELFW